jgi:ABC-type bacteriocin/lantibiotic exporter with double-glycine peptidase domain
MSVAALRQALLSGGVETRALRVRDASSLGGLPLPQILYWDENHFVVAEGYREKYVAVADPAFGRRRVPWDEFASHFTHIAVVPRSALPNRKARARNSGNGKFRVRSMLQLSEGRYLRWLIGIGLATILLDVLALSTIFVLRMMLAHVGASLVTSLLATLAVLACLEVGGLGLRSLLIARAQTAAESQMHTMLFERLLHLDWTFFAHRSKGDLLSRLEFVKELYSRLFHDYVLAIFGLATSAITLAALAVVNIEAAAAVTLVAAACFQAARLVRENFVSTATTTVEARIRLASFADEVLGGLEGLKGVRAEQAVGRIWRVRRARLAAASTLDRLRSNALDAVHSAVVRVAQVVIVAIAAITASRTQSAGNLVAVLSLSGMCLAPFMLAIRNYVTWGEMESYITRFNDLLEREPAVLSQAGPRREFESLSVRGISFAFGGGRTILDQVSFDIAAGDHVGIWAPSGTGKTTLLRIISGSLRPTHGSVYVNGMPFAEAAREGFFCGIVPQETSLISGTIAENIRLGDPDATDDEVMAACSAAGLTRDIARMPNGLQTQLSVNGGGISGGQRQRIAIARAVLSRPDILLLDEATAALDRETEASIIHGLRHMTLIVVSHREELMGMMDRVVTLADPDLNAMPRTEPTSWKRQES